jgi:hypothetical protein
MCPKAPLECQSLPYSDTQLARHLTAHAFTEYLGRRSDLVKQRLEAEQDQEIKEAVRTEIARLAALDQERRAIEAACNEIEEHLLMGCSGGCRYAPRWDAVVPPDFVDCFCNCFALYCPMCSARPCAWCWRDVGPDNGAAHAHVRECREAPEPERSHRNRALYCRDRDHREPHVKEKFDSHWQARKRALVQGVLDALDGAIRRQVQEKLRAELSDLDF